MKIAEGKFVVTGGASLIGSHVAEQLLSQGAREVVLLDNFSLGNPETVKSLLGNPRVKLLRGDILRINELYDAFEGCDGVFAIAGFLTLPLSQNPSLGLAVNVEGQVNIFEACRYRNVKKVVFSSSVAVYGDPAPGLVDEQAPAQLSSFQPAAALYACTKLIGENLSKLYSAKHGIQAIGLRYSTVYGERQHYRGVNALYIMENYDRIARGEAPVITGDGSEVHDYIHVADVARANVMAMASDVTAESFNVVTGVATSLNRLVEILLSITGSSLKPVFKAGGGSVRSSVTDQLDFSRAKIEKMLGWVPEVSIEEGIRRLLEWRKAQDKAVS
ncbi:NAD-dependent epimerase/dehydratase family protein [Afipia sp. GAS231]|uniref:NAD-dependent epimerase/dehydratase family protein n=1 Tax=Afipia sp. GAS231 TaxID=1882747 RepID=UPI00087CB719|nr:NAD-dependent epimerase/dehydratase family protein [Afipia sp. GAS231]SDO89352.1 UDP-glucose 4-epimerase [Afipia sp. GAS231]